MKVIAFLALVISAIALYVSNDSANTAKQALAFSQNEESNADLAGRLRDLRNACDVYVAAMGHLPAGTSADATLMSSYEPYRRASAILTPAEVGPELQQARQQVTADYVKTYDIVQRDCVDVHEKVERRLRSLRELTKSER